MTDTTDTAVAPPPEESAPYDPLRLARPRNIVIAVIVCGVLGTVLLNVGLPSLRPFATSITSKSVVHSVPGGTLSGGNSVPMTSTIQASYTYSVTNRTFAELTVTCLTYAISGRPPVIDQANSRTLTIPSRATRKVSGQITGIPLDALPAASVGLTCHRGTAPVTSIK